MCLESVGEKALKENDILFVILIIEFKEPVGILTCIFIDEESKPIDRNSTQDLDYLSLSPPPPRCEPIFVLFLDPPYT